MKKKGITIGCRQPTFLVRTKKSKDEGGGISNLEVLESTDEFQ